MYSISAAVNSDRLHVRKPRFEAAHQRQPIIQRQLARVVAPDDVDLVEVGAGFERFTHHGVCRHAHRTLRFFELVGRKRTELAARVTHVGGIDVAVEDVKDFLAALAFLCCAGKSSQRVNVRRAEKHQAVVDGQRDALVYLMLDRLERGVHRQCHGRSLSTAERTHCASYCTARALAAQRTFTARKFDEGCAQKREYAAQAYSAHDVGRVVGGKRQAGPNDPQPHRRKQYERRPSNPCGQLAHHEHYAGQQVKRRRDGGMRARIRKRMLVANEPVQSPRPREQALETRSASPCRQGDRDDVERPHAQAANENAGCNANQIQRTEHLGPTGVRERPRNPYGVAAHHFRKGPEQRRFSVRVDVQTEPPKPGEQHQCRKDERGNFSAAAVNRRLRRDPAVPLGCGPSAARSVPARPNLSECAWAWCLHAGLRF